VEEEEEQKEKEEEEEGEAYLRKQIWNVGSHSSFALFIPCFVIFQTLLTPKKIPSSTMCTFFA
jgi:hypothetical protein